MLGEGRLEDVAQVAREFGREANADMGFKAIWWLGAVAGESNLYDGKVWEYQPVWGTGSAIVELTPAPHKAIDFEKEFDEAPVATDGEQGTGLESHNVLTEGPRVHESSEMSSQEEMPATTGGGQAPSHGAGSGQAGAPVLHKADTVTTAKAAKPVGPYPHARRVGDLLFLSGIGPRRAGTNEIPEGIEAQTRAVADNLRAVLEDAGSSLEKILDVTVYLTDMKRDFDRFNKVYGEIFGAIQPTRTTVGVDSLPTPISVELKVIAAK